MSIVWSSRLFWKLFITYAALNLAATVMFVVIVSGWQESQVEALLQQQLASTARLVRSNFIDALPDGSNDTLQQQVKHLGSEVETRITLVDMEGVVLADSSRDGLAEVQAMENHHQRVELVRARELGFGTSERISPTLKSSMLYVAIRADLNEKPVGLVRTAMQTDDIRAEVASIKRLIWLVGALVSLGVVFLSYFVAATVARPVTRLTSAAESIADGDYRERVYIRSHDELGVLARGFNRMSDQLSSREMELRESGQRLTTVLEGMAEGVISLDDRQRVVLANAAAGRLMSFSPSDAQGRPLLEVVRSHKLHAALVECQADQESRRVEIEMGDQEPRALSVYANLLTEEPTTRFILVIQDVTELRRLESMRQEFVANVSHELKTPLSAIKAYAETLSQGALDDRDNRLRFVQNIEDQAERLHQLILDLLSLARIESGQQAFDIGTVDVQEVVTSCLKQQQAQVAAKRLTINSDAHTPNLNVVADEEGVRQILNNLINNAIKYTPEGGSITVAWKGEAEYGVIEVRDSGIGIPAQHLPRLFERFYRVDKARSRELGGTGLGLSIVKHLTQSFNGRVDVESEPGRGTTFTVRLPRI